MKTKYRLDLSILIPIILFFIISIISIASAQKLLGNPENFLLKQVFWYGVSAVLIFVIMFLSNKSIINNIWIFYGISVISLVLLLLFATPINNAKCWFTLPGLGSIQPSEFTKIILIITLAKMINNFRLEYNNPTVKEELLFLLKVGVVVLIPSILTFLQPDTGVVLIYLIITLTMLFIAGIRYRWFAILFGVLFSFLAIILLTYFFNPQLFIDLFGTSFFLRVDRLLDWSSKSGYQLENGLSAIGSGGLMGNGIFNTPIYFPEPQTDFIFAVFASNFGFIGCLILIILVLFFIVRLIFLAINSSQNINKYIIAGFLGMLIYQQFQNIGMTLGIMPITGITLPFISYGGSSLLSYMLMLGIIFNISNEERFYRNKKIN